MRLATQPSGLTDRPSGFDVRPSAGLVCVRLELRVFRVQMDASWHDGRPPVHRDSRGSVEVVVRSQQPWWLARNNPPRLVLTAFEFGIGRPKGERSMNIVLVVKNPSRLHMHCRDSNAGMHWYIGSAETKAR